MGGPVTKVPTGRYCYRGTKYYYRDGMDHFVEIEGNSMKTDYKCTFSFGDASYTFGIKAILLNMPRPGAIGVVGLVQELVSLFKERLNLKWLRLEKLRLAHQTPTTQDSVHERRDQNPKNVA